VRVATYNVLHGRSVAHGQVRQAELVEAAIALDADVVGLQEVDLAQERSGGIDQTAAVAHALGAEHWRFVPALHGTPGG
jgi:endonuclease/exonuclease/phosphatase family metal-dependent hydrolase